MDIRRVALTTLAVPALAIAGCGAPAAGGTTPPPAISVSPAVTSSAAESTTSAPADASTPASAPAGDDVATVNDGALAAIATAEKEAGGAALKIDDENVDREWEVDVLVGDKVVEVKVSRDGTEVLGQEDDGDVDDGEKAEPGQLVEAIKAALAHTPGTLDDAKLDEDDGALYWKVELDQTGPGDDVELRVDPGTLEVTPDR